MPGNGKAVVVRDQFGAVQLIGQVVVGVAVVADGRDPDTVEVDIAIVRENQLEQGRIS